MEWKVDDWCVFDFDIGQIKRLDGKFGEFTEGQFSTSGQIVERFRPLTLRNKCVAENMQYWYRELNKIDGERGFNYPRICQYFHDLALQVMDTPEEEKKAVEAIWQKARDFVSSAKNYEKNIDGVQLFRHA